MTKVYKVRSQVWLHPGEMGAWHFTNLDKKLSSEFREKYGEKKRGFGSIPVLVTIGKTSWKTSVFPDKRSGTYLLPLKAQVRRAEGVEAGEIVKFSIAPRL